MRFALLFLLCIGQLSTAADLQIKGHEKVKRDSLIVLSAENVPENSLLIWTITPKVKTREVGKDLLLAAPPGIYSVQLTAATFVLKDKIVLPSKIETEFTFTVEGQTPPKPGPDPGPGPDPVPTVGPMSVLITYESSQQLGPKQGPILTSKLIHEYLDAKCKDGTQGRKDWMIADKDFSLSQESEAIQKAGKVAKTTLPWIQIIPQSGPSYEGPLPATVDETLTLLKKYGG